MFINTLDFGYLQKLLVNFISGYNENTLRKNGKFSIRETAFESEFTWNFADQLVILLLLQVQGDETFMQLLNLFPTSTRMSLTVKIKNFF